MDREQFDALTRLVWTSSSRRTALGALLGVAVFGPSSLATAKPKAKAKRKRKRKQRQVASARTCYPGANCRLGQGQKGAGCDFSGSTRFFDGDFHGSNYSNANFTGAQMAKSNFHGADLGGACLVGANLHHATIDNSTNLKGAIFCRTLMPDGTINDQHCGQGTACCPTLPPICRAGEECGPEASCITGRDKVCSILFPSTNCCPDFVCTPTVGILLTECQYPCSQDSDCDILHGDLHCNTDGQDGACPFLHGCCRPKPCRADFDCPVSGICNGHSEHECPTNIIGGECCSPT